MKILCDRQQLQEAFAIVASIAPPKSPKPVLQNVLMKASDDGLMLFATDLEMSAKVVLDSVKVDKPGSVLIPAREGAALLRELSEPTVTLVAKENRCTVESGGGSFILVGEDPEQFPLPAASIDAKQAVLPAGRFADMIKKTLFASAKEETRYAVSGAMIDIKKGTLRLVATDGRRMALNYHHLEGKVADVNRIVPLRALMSLARAIPEGHTEDLKIRFGDQQIGFTFGKTELISRILDVRFPDYEGVMPKAADTTVEISRDLLSSNLRKVMVMCGSDLRMVRFHFNSSSVGLSSEGHSGRADVTIDAVVKGAGGSIAFNPDFVLEGLKVAEFDITRVDLTDDGTPAKFTLGESFTYIVMPISGS